MFFVGWEMQYDENSHSYGQLVSGRFIMAVHQLMPRVSCRVFWQNIKSPRWLSSPAAQIWTLWLLAFPKTKITFERVISDLQWNSGKQDGAADGDWENCVRSQGAYYEQDWDVTVFPVTIRCPVIFSWVLLMVWNLFPFKGDFSFGKSQKLQDTKSGL